MMCWQLWPPREDARARVCKRRGRALALSMCCLSSRALLYLAMSDMPFHDELAASITYLQGHTEVASSSRKRKGERARARERDSSKACLFVRE
eukprot:6184475-Pleurochrysis_carterae.AAC.2